ncbi:MAG: peptide ABC transporter substrate-binding protein [Clostridia bacterium]
MKKVLAMVLAISLLLTCAIGFAEGEEGSSITFNIGQEPTPLDPGLNSGIDGSLILTHTYEGLVKEVNHEVVLGVAESYDVSDDGLVYTFHLRDTAWSDGQPLVAQQFEFAWKRAQDPAVASSYSWIFDAANIVSYRAVDDKTFEVTLSVPGPVFFQVLTGVTFMPLREDMVDYTSGAWAIDPAKAVSNGAYYMTDYTAGDRLVLQKNPNYYDKDAIKVDTLVGMMIVDQTTALTGYESGQIDALCYVPPAEIPRLLNEEPDFAVSPANSANFYAFNVTKAPFTDIRVRQALSYSINRTAIVNDVLKDGSTVAWSLIPGVVYDDQGRKFNEVSGDYGIPTDDSKYAEAKQLLSDAGFPDGAGFPEITILYNTSETNKAIAEAIQQMWMDNLGISVKLSNMESAVFHQTRVAHDFEVCRGGWWGDYADPLTHLDLYVSGNFGNYADWRNPEYDQLIAEAKLLSGAARFEKFYAADKLLSESFAYMPIAYAVHTSLINSDKVIGAQMSSTGVLNFLNAEVIG